MNLSAHREVEGRLDARPVHNDSAVSRRRELVMTSRDNPLSMLDDAGADNVNAGTDNAGAHHHHGGSALSTSTARPSPRPMPGTDSMSLSDDEGPGPDGLDVPRWVTREPGVV
jgi:hypothetical protein